MKMTAEISMYPLCDDFIPPIKAVIDRLHGFPGLVVTTSATATTVTGDYDGVMEAIAKTVAWSYERYGMAVFIAKLIPGYIP